ncbi:GNAT family N-acetyltransferase [Phenylobacterium sp.]|uniref:GNAT family N-acetyltransferase n=1 Tax=Phenylobacterium sp. TaxID=1871053 RepID=UPI002D106B73|nr:GNAT family N-acetyltransferase [Phenylobacterium sp.]HVI34193.1 GNAT family N-acetyltransferase [Phenylobacterium sp.]
MAPLAPLTPDDIPEVMRLERLPGYDAFIGRFEAGEHAALMASEDARYFGVRKDGGGLSGFAILQQMREPMVLLRRIAVESPGGGAGTRLLRAVTDWVFETTPAEALELDVALGNARAQHVYAREGFTEFRPPDEVHYFLKITRARWATLREAVS